MPLEALFPLVAEAGKVAVNGFLTQRAAAYNQSMNEKNMARNFKYSQMAQANASANEVAGMKRAGLNPALANGAAAAPIAASNNGTAQPVQVDPANMLLFAQLDKLKADKEKAESETAGQEISNAEKNAKNKFTGESMRVMASQMLDKPYVRNFPEVKAFFERLKGDRSLNSGSLDAWSAMVRQMAENPEAVSRKLKEEFNQANEGWKQEYRLSEAQINKLTEEAVNLTQQFEVLHAQQMALESGNKLTEQQIKQSEAAVKQIDQSIKQIKAMTEKLNDYNLPKLLKDGDWKGASAAVIALLIEGVMRKGF